MFDSYHYASTRAGDVHIWKQQMCEDAKASPWNYKVDNFGTETKLLLTILKWRFLTHLWVGGEATKTNSFKKDRFSQAEHFIRLLLSKGISFSPVGNRNRMLECVCVWAMFETRNPGKLLSEMVFCGMAKIFPITIFLNVLHGGANLIFFLCGSVIKDILRTVLANFSNHDFRMCRSTDGLRNGTDFCHQIPNTSALAVMKGKAHENVKSEGIKRFDWIVLVVIQVTRRQERTVPLWSDVLNWVRPMLGHFPVRQKWQRSGLMERSIGMVFDLHSCWITYW